MIALLKSLRDTASQSSFEVRLRSDLDDTETLSAIPECRSIVQNLHHFVGPRLNGWQSVATFWDELYQTCVGDWAWMLSDDMLVEGVGWDKLLAEVPTEGFIVHPGIHKLGFSTYKEDRGGPVPIVPRGALERFGFPGIPNPPDERINVSFLAQSGWQIRFLPGIAIWHQRDDDSSLIEERKK